MNLLSNDLELSLPSFSDHRTCSQSVSNAISHLTESIESIIEKFFFYIELIKSGFEFFYLS